MKHVVAMFCALAFAGSLVAQAAELKSGPQVGDMVGAFYVEKVAGAVNDNVSVGKQLCYRCMLGNKPVVMVFARKADKNLASLVKELEQGGREEFGSEAVELRESDRLEARNLEERGQGLGVEQ